MKGYTNYGFLSEERGNKKLNDFLQTHTIITNSDNLHDIPKEDRVPVYREESYVADYIEDGYESFSIYTTKSRGNARLAFRIAMVLAELNRDKDPQVLCECMNLICHLRYDSMDMVVSRTTITNIIDSVFNDEIDVQPTIKKWSFRGILNKDEKRSIIFSYINETRSQNNFRKVESAVRCLIDAQSETENFITIRDVVEITGLSKSTVKKYIVVFRDEINDCNMRSFLTDNYSVFSKRENVYKISSVIEKYIEEQEKSLTRKKVSYRSKLHYNTVKSLWFEEEVQEALEKYNKEKVNFKKEEEMIKALSKDNKMITATKGEKANCPECGEELTAKICKTRRSHWVHPANSTCRLSVGEGELTIDENELYTHKDFKGEKFKVNSKVLDCANVTSLKTNKFYLLPIKELEIV